MNKPTGFDEIKLLLESVTKYPIEKEFRFHPVRKWRFDYSIPDALLAIEIEGGVFSGGRHVRGVGYIKDMEKYNAAQILGWTVLRYTYGQENKILDDVKTYLLESESK